MKQMLFFSHFPFKQKQEKIKVVILEIDHKFRLGVTKDLRSQCRNQTYMR